MHGCGYIQGQQIWFGSVLVNKHNRWRDVVRSLHIILLLRK